MFINFSPFPELKTERLILRRLSDSDDQIIFSIRRSVEINRYLDRSAPSTIGEARKFIQKIMDGIYQNKWIYCAICQGGEPDLIGTICGWNFSEDGSMAEIGYEMIPDFQGRGFMNEALVCVLDYCFGTLGLEKIEACTHVDNERSSRLLERNHFILEAGRREEENPHYIVYSLIRPG